MFPLNLPNALTLVRDPAGPRGRGRADRRDARRLHDAGQQGVVIPASGLGKVKTIVQVAAVLALIAASDHNDAWVQALVYAMVAVTVASGADYFLNFRRRLDEAGRDRTSAARPRP